MNAETAQLREQLAAIEHQRWAGWQQWVHKSCTDPGDGTLIIPAELVTRWNRQIATEYAELCEDDQQKDRDQVDRYWPLIAARLERHEETSQWWMNIAGNTAKAWAAERDIYLQRRPLTDADTVAARQLQAIYQLREQLEQAHRDLRLRTSELRQDAV
jgi:hypothetical protein